MDCNECEKTEYSTKLLSNPTHLTLNTKNHDTIEEP